MARAGCASWSGGWSRPDPALAVGRDRYRRAKVQLTAAEALKTVAAEHHLTDEMRAHRVIVDWSTIVGPRIAKVAWPESLTKGVLWVRVKTSPWLHELSLLKGPLLAELHQQLGEPDRPPLITDLRFSLRPRPTADDDLLGRLRAAGLVREPRPKLTPVAAVGEAKAAIEREADVVDDPELRDVIKAVRVRNGR